MVFVSKTKIIDRGWKQIKKNIFSMDGDHTAVGWIASESGQDNVNKAVWNEFGTKRGIPSRPFMRRTFDRHKAETRKLLKQYAALVVAGKISRRKALRQVGEIYSGMIKKKIRRGRYVANEPKTIMQKGSSKPLIDKGEMLNSITHKEFV